MEKKHDNPDKMGGKKLNVHLKTVKDDGTPTSYDPVALGNTIRLLREQLNLTQTELGTLAHLSTAEISKLENGGRKKIPTETLIKISPHLNVSIDYLLASCLSFHRSDHERFYDYDGNEIDLYKVSKNLYSVDSRLLILLSSPDFLSDAEIVDFIKSCIQLNTCINQTTSSSDIINRMFTDFKTYCGHFINAIAALTVTNN